MRLSFVICNLLQSFLRIWKHLASLDWNRSVVTSQIPYYWQNFQPITLKFSQNVLSIFEMVCKNRHRSHPKFLAVKGLDRDRAFCPPPRPSPANSGSRRILSLLRYGPARAWPIDYHWIVLAAAFRFPAMRRKQTLFRQRPSAELAGEGRHQSTKIAIKLPSVRITSVCAPMPTYFFYAHAENTFRVLKEPSESGDWWKFCSECVVLCMSI